MIRGRAGAAVAALALPVSILSLSILSLSILSLSIVTPAHADPAPADPAPPLYELLDAAAARLATADAVAATKWLNGGPINDPARVRQVLDAVAAQARSAGVPADYVTAVFTDQIDATEAVQYSRFSWWKFDPATAPVTAPDLSASRAAIDELNQRMVAEIAEDWQALNSPNCAALLDGARMAVADQRRLDPLYRQALAAATRSYCD